MPTAELNFTEILWPLDRVDEAVSALLRSSRFFFEHTAEISPISVMPTNKIEFETILSLWVAQNEFEVEPVQAKFNEITGFMASASPTLLVAWEEDDGKKYNAGFVVLLKSGDVCEVFGIDHSIKQINLEKLSQLFMRRFDDQVQQHANQLLQMTNLSDAKKATVGKALIDSWLGNDPIELGWYLRPSPARNLLLTLASSKTFLQAIGWFIVYNINTLTQVLAWWLLGSVVLDGQTDTAWLVAWALMIFTGLPVQLLASWLQNQFILSISIHFKQRSLFGMLNLNPDDIRHLGSGGLLERVYQAESIEMLAISGGLKVFLSITQLIGAGFVLAQSPFGQLSITLMLVWLSMIFFAGWITYRQQLSWLGNYRDMNNSLVEKMLGHRTRLAQENPNLRHIDEDAQVERYLEESKKNSYVQSFLNSLQTSWMIAGVGSMTPSLMGYIHATPVDIAVGFGGIMLASQAFGLIQNGLLNGIATWINYEQLKPIFDAVNKKTPQGDPQVQTLTRGSNRERSTKKRSLVFSARNLVYSYPGRATPVLQGCDADLYSGDRVVLTGSSGGGKTTLASVIAGIRKPDSGLMLMNGFDMPSIGSDAWRKKVVLAPQFYENHIFNETFGFNLLVGRRWPATSQDIEEARAVCEELGLGDLLNKMPSGFHQMMGENGWRLSHGEKSRVFIARAILQNAEVLIMDESFGALDPENLLKALECVDRRAKSLVIIAHP